MPQSRFRNRRTAFTLVELLVVISIIGVLMALLLPAVNAARMAALRATCQARMTDLGRATQIYEQSKKKFPSSFSAQAVLGTTYTFPWTVRLLPNLEQQQLYDTIIYRTPTTTKYIETFVCSADTDAGDTAPLSYVANVGRPDLLDTTTITASNPNAPRNLKANGIFHDARAFPQHDVNMLYVTKGDGSAYTLLYTENRNATTWNDTNEYNVGFVWAVDNTELGGTNLDMINSQNTTQTGYPYARPSANHSDTFNNVFADGSVRPLSQEIDPGVFARIMTPRGADTQPPQTGTVTAKDLEP